NDPMSTEIGKRGGANAQGTVNNPLLVPVQLDYTQGGLPNQIRQVPAKPLYEAMIGLEIAGCPLPGGFDDFKLSLCELPNRLVSSREKVANGRTIANRLSFVKSLAALHVLKYLPQVIR